MSDDETWGFAAPAFKPDLALVQLKRALRELRPLAERGNGFTLQGQEVIQLSLDDGQLIVRLAKKPARSPEWERHICRNAGELRRLQDDIKRRLARWTDED